MKTLPFLLAAILSGIAAPPSPARAEEPIRIATEGAYPPFNFVNPDGSLGGLDVDIANALCAAMQTRCTIRAQDWDGLIPALQDRRFDAIVASLSVTPERQAVIDFSDSYYSTPLSLVATRESGIDSAEPAALKNRTVGVQGATRQAEDAETRYGRAGAEVKLYPSQEELSADMENGRLDAMVTDKFVVFDWLAKAGESCCRSVGDLPGTDVPAAIGLRKGDPLRERFNRALAAIRADGTYAAIVAKYFPFKID